MIAIWSCLLTHMLFVCIQEGAIEVTAFDYESVVSLVQFYFVHKVAKHVERSLSILLYHHRDQQAYASYLITVLNCCVNTFLEVSKCI